MNSTSPRQLFSASCTALVVTALAFAIRGGIMAELGDLFHLDGTHLGWIAGAAFWGTAISLMASGPLCDITGMGRLLVGACIAHAAGILLTIFSIGFWSLFFSTLLIGIGNGLIEGAANPMVATLYKIEKAKRLNLFHAWYPGGVIMGGLLAYGLSRWGVGWQLQVSVMLLPTIAYGLMFIGQKFPQTERVASGISNREMLAECCRPLFFFVTVCMLLTAATESGTNQWIATLLEHSGIPGILVLVWITGFMMMGRLSIGPVERRLGITGILLLASILTAVGLYWMSSTHGRWALPAAAVYALGVCYFWPTMLGFVAERLPKSGALGLSLIGGIGMISIAIALPIVGHIYDGQLARLLPPGVTMEAIRSAVPNTTGPFDYAAVQLAAGSATLGQIAVLPCILIVAFTLLLLQQRGKPSIELQRTELTGEET